MKTSFFNSTSNPQPKFYLSKNKKYQKYYVIINHYDPITKKTRNKYKSLKTGNKQIALANFQRFVNNYCNSITETPINKNITIQDFYNEVSIQLKINLNPNTVINYNLSVRKFLELVTNKILRLITAQDLENFKVKRLQQNVSKSEVNKELNCLKALFNTAVQMNYLSVNPGRFTKIYSIVETKIKVFSESEIDLLLANIKNKTLLNIVKFALASGLRLNEILNIQISDIDYPNGIINIQNKQNFQTKNKKNKILILNNKLKSLISEILNINTDTNVFDISACNPDKYLFTAYSRNYPLNKSSVSRNFKKELRKLNLNEDLHFHSLRHTYISNLVSKGVPLNFVKELVGHSNINTTMKYITINKAELVKYANL